MSNVQDIQKKAADTEVRGSFLASPTVRQYSGIIISLAVLCVVFSVMSPRFLALNNFMNIMQQVAVIAVAAYGMTYVILLGDIDLSIGSIIAVSGSSEIAAVRAAMYASTPDATFPISCIASSRLSQSA